MSKTALITGASGLVGSELLKQLLADEDYAKVIALVRTPLETRHEKLIQKIVDFETISASMEDIRADHAFCCLGTTIRKAGSQARQYRIDHDYVVCFAKACIAAGISKFAVVSSAGAKTKTGNFYLRTKGEMEEELRKVPFEGLYILRPSLLMGKRKEFRLGELIAKGAMKVINPLLAGGLKRYRGIEASRVASGMIKAVEGPGGVHIFESDKIQVL
ncbi:MAG TPA: oxidoreductase [Bacteroidales bacterium]|nr:oxidoreductase [Bacteroidales bacterium]HPT12285.1 oxidoreductase [Bacteroidales bacterium]